MLLPLGHSGVWEVCALLKTGKRFLTLSLLPLLSKCARSLEYAQYSGASFPAGSLLGHRTSRCLSFTLKYLGIDPWSQGKRSVFWVKVFKNALRYLQTLDGLQHVHLGNSHRHAVNILSRSPSVRIPDYFFFYIGIFKKNLLFQDPTLGHIRSFGKGRMTSVAGRP